VVEDLNRAAVPATPFESVSTPPARDQLQL